MPEKDIPVPAVYVVSESAPQAKAEPVHLAIWPEVQASPVTVLPVLLNSPLPVKVRTFSLPLNVFQSAEVSNPVVEVVAVGIAADLKSVV